jgi:thymidylate synthase ThyX
MITANIVADSTSEDEVRLTTFKLSYPRFIHSEFNTHRVFSRNASSSRAEPVSKHIDRLYNDFAMPEYWGKNKAGMQAEEELIGAIKEAAIDTWKEAKDSAVFYARKLNNLGVHKQITNRLLEPFSHIHVVVTATEWDNFFLLRRHPSAQPEIHKLADLMHEALLNSYPKLIKNTEWHIPFLSEQEAKTAPLHEQLIHSIARCARTSYLKHDNTESSLEDDRELFNRLVKSEPIHASPTEHQATPFGNRDTFNKNFRGWQQLRHFLEISPKGIIKNLY